MIDGRIKTDWSIFQKLENCKHWTLLKQNNLLEKIRATYLSS